MVLLADGTHGYDHSQSASSVLMSNDDSKSWVVHKYGGTAVGKFATAIAGIVRNDLNFNRVAVVCSARSTSTKSEGTTNK